MNINWALLRKQKAALVSMAGEENRLTSEVAVLDGIVHLLDYLQDTAVEAGIADEENVFGEDHE